MIKDIPGFEDLYYINSNGEVFSYDRMRSNNRFFKGKQLAFKKDKDGYIVMILTDYNGKPLDVKIHQVMMELFGPPRPSRFHHPNHIDLDKSNNHISNLEWLTHQENIKHAIENDRHFTPFKDFKGENHYKAKVSEDIVREIRKRYKPFSKRNGCSAMAREFKIGISTVHSIITRSSWKHIE
jgi:hypothetical protein